MSTVNEVEAAIQQFSREELAEFDKRYSEFKADAWDRQIEEDAAAGRLDWLAKQAIADHAAGRCTDL